MRLSLVPEGSRGNIILKGKITRLTFNGRAPAERLNSRYGARSFDLSQVNNSVPRHINAGRNFPALAQLAGSLGPSSLVAMSSCPFSPVKFSALIERVTALDS